MSRSLTGPTGRSGALLADHEGNEFCVFEAGCQEAGGVIPVRR